MNRDEFWELMALVDQAALTACDEQSAVVPLQQRLSQLPEQELEQFEQILSELLYALDGQKWADGATESGRSGDGFLYCRCFVVARGRAFYERALKDPAAMPKTLDEWCEPLLYVASRAWAETSGRNYESWDFIPTVSYETCSNRSQWPHLSAG